MIVLMQSFCFSTVRDYFSNLVAVALDGDETAQENCYGICKFFG